MEGLIFGILRYVEQRDQYRIITKRFNERKVLFLIQKPS